MRIPVLPLCSALLTARRGAVFRGFGISLQGIIIYRAAYFGGFDTAKHTLMKDGKKLNFFAAWILALVLSELR